MMQQGDRPGFVRLAAMADGTKLARGRIVESFAQWLKQPAEPFIDQQMLSRRDMFAAMAMNGILAANAKCADEVTDKNVDQVVARESVASADALIAELDSSTNRGDNLNPNGKG